MTELFLIGVVGLLFSMAAFLFMSRSTIRLVLGTFLLSNATHLSIFISGRLTREVPPLVPDGLKVPPEAIANPLPQALILTAIVISFALTAFIFVLVYRAYQELGTVNADEMRVAEPKDEDPVPFDVLPVTQGKLDRKAGARGPASVAPGAPAGAAPQGAGK